MIDLKVHIAIFFIPMVVGNIMHMLIVKLDMFHFLTFPLSVDYFGPNKTYRGFIFLTLVSGLLAIMGNAILLDHDALSTLKAFEIGSGLGFIYLLSELPNSYAKRKLGLHAGEISENYRIFQMIVDKSDSLIGIMLFYYVVTNTSFADISILFIVSFVLHASLSFALYKLKIKKSF